MYNLLILILGVYGVSKLLTDYDGPWGVFYNLRKLKFMGALHCTICVSVYVAVVMSLLLFFGWHWFVTVCAIVGAVVFIEEKL